jgi:arylsulfatase A-like enzyme
MPPDLVMLLVDTARADAFGPWGAALPTPGIERLAAEGVVYEQALAQAPWTLSSTASIFSGRLPSEHGITGDCFRWEDGRPSSPAEAVRECAGPWLPEALRQRGYRTWGGSCNAWISPWGGFDRGFDEFLHLHNRARMPSHGAGRALWKARRLAGGIDRGGRQCLREFRGRLDRAGSPPLFAFVNLMEVHSPYSPPRRFYPFAPWTRQRTRALTTGTTRFLSYNAGVSAPPSGYVETIRTLYGHAARYADWLVGEFVAAIRSSGRPTAVAVVSDHGENLGEHGLFHHNSSLHETLLRVPLVLWGQGVDVGQGHVPGPVSLRELLPWALRVAEDGRDAGHFGSDGPVVSEYESAVRHNGVPEPVRRGLSGVDPVSVPPLFEHAGVVVRDGHLKYVAVEDGRRALFDLRDDPGEERDLLPSSPELAERFAGQVEGWRERSARRPTYEVGETAEDEIAEHLSMLGYIE